MKTASKAMTYERTGIIRSHRLQQIVKTHDVRHMTTLQLFTVIYRRWEIEILTAVAVASMTWAIISNIR